MLFCVLFWIYMQHSFFPFLFLYLAFSFSTVVCHYISSSAVFIAIKGKKDCTIYFNIHIAVQQDRLVNHYSRKICVCVCFCERIICVHIYICRVFQHYNGNRIEFSELFIHNNPVCNMTLLFCVDNLERFVHFCSV